MTKAGHCFVSEGRRTQDLGDDVGLAVEVPSAIHHHAFAHEQAELAGGLLEPEREEREGDVRPVLLLPRKQKQTFQELYCVRRGRLRPRHPGLGGSDGTPTTKTDTVVPEQGIIASAP